MIVTLDGRRVRNDFAAGGTLQNVIDDVLADLDAESLVTSVAINGEVLVEDELSERLNQPLDVSDQIDLESGERGVLVAEALRNAADQINEAGRRAVEIAGRLNGGQAGQALRETGEMVRVWQACGTGIEQSGALLGRDLTQVQFEGQPVARHLGDLLGRLGDLRNALRAGDNVALADLLHYEMPDLCAHWRSLLTHLADNVNPQNCAGG